MFGFGFWAVSSEIALFASKIIHGPSHFSFPRCFHVKQSRAQKSSLVFSDAAPRISGQKYCFNSRKSSTKRWCHGKKSFEHARAGKKREPEPPVGHELRHVFCCRKGGFHIFASKPDSIPPHVVKKSDDCQIFFSKIYAGATVWDAPFTGNPVTPACKTRFVKKSAASHAREKVKRYASVMQ